MDTSTWFDAPPCLCPGLKGPAPEGPAVVGWHCLRFATVNVQTLASDPREASSHFEGRIGYLRDQLEEHAVHVAALQEARTSKAECLLSGNFIRLCSGATESGHLGTECWFARRRDSHSRGFLPDELTVVYWDPRCICIQVRSKCLKALVVGVHAPTAQDPLRASWWRKLCDRLRRLGGSSEVCVIGDFNTRFDQEIPCRIGSHVWSSKYRVPEEVYRLLQEQDLWIPSTFEGLHSGQHETWISPGGTAAARLDYHAIPSSWIVSPECSWVALVIDPGHESVDHFTVCLDVWIQGSGVGRQGGRAPAFDRAKMGTAEGQRVIRKICDGGWYHLQ